MEIKEKIAKLIQAATNIGKQREEAKAQREVKKKEANQFFEALVDGLKQKKISYDEAVQRIKLAARDSVEMYYLLDKLDEAYWPTVKTASLNNTENKQGGPIMKELEETKKRLPHYGAFLEQQLKKEGYYFGTGTAPNHKQWDIGATSAEEKSLKESIKEGEKLMKDKMRQKDEVKRAYYEELGTGGAPKHDQWDLGVSKAEDKAMSEGIRETEKIRKENEKEKERINRAKQFVKVKLAKDVDNPKKSKWQIFDRNTGQLVVEASISDIVEGADVSPEVIQELTSDEYGKMIYESIATDGLATTAYLLTGMTKTAQEKEMFGEGSNIPEEEEEAMWEGENPTLEEELEEAGFSEINPETGEIIETPEEEKVEEWEEAKPSGVELFGTKNAALESTNPLEGEEEEEKKEEEEGELGGSSGTSTALKQSALSVEFFTLKGVLADLKEENKLLKSAAISTLLKRAEEKLQELKKTIETNPEAEEEIATKAEDVTQELGNIDKYISDLKDALNAGDLTKATEIVKELEDAVKAKAGEESPALEVTSSFAKLRKTAKQDEYDITPKANFQKEYHSGQGDTKKLPDTTIWGVRKEFEKLVNKKPTGKLASSLNKIRQAGTEYLEGKTKNEYEKYLRDILGEKEYAKKMTEDVTPEEVAKEGEKTATASSDPVKVLRAVDAAEAMQKKGLIPNTKQARDKQVSTFLKMADDQFEAFIESVENISPTTELEEGRVSVEVTNENIPGRDVKAMVDGKVVAYFSADELGAKKGQITKKALHTAIVRTKYALEEGLFDEILSEGKVDKVAGVDVKLNLDRESDRPELRSYLG